MSNSSPSSEAKASKPKPFSIALSTGISKPSSSPSSQRASQSSSRTSTPRPDVFATSKPSRTAFHHDESEGEDEHPPVQEEVTAFDHAAGGAISAHRRKPVEKAPLVIKVDSKNNWRDRVTRGKKSWLPEEVRAQRAAEKSAADTGAQVEVEAPSASFGLSFAQPAKEASEARPEDVPAKDVAMVDADTELPPTNVPQSQDDIALQALIRESKGEGEGETRRSNMVIETQWSTNGVVRREADEVNSFRSDVASRPEPASLADYSAVPVEEFGAALLRGMGWKEGEPVGRGKYSDGDSNKAALKPRVLERRPGYLGIGAKDIGGKAGGAEAELGAWGKSAMRKAKKPGEGLYTPVLMRNKKTGEQMTEDEFKAMQKEKEKEADEWKERRDRNLQKHGRGGSGRDYGDSADSDGYRRSGDSSSRNGSLSPDRDGRSRKDRGHRDRRSEERRYRDRDRDRDRERDRDRDRDRERASRSRRDKDDGRSRGGDESRSHRSSRRSPERDYKSHRSSRRHDSRSDRDGHRDTNRDRWADD